MARIRSLKPEFWSDEKVMEISFGARLLFMGLWNFCDREGRMVYSPKRIKAQVFPGDGVDVVPLFEELQRIGLVTIYQASNARILSIPNFTKHQILNAREPISLLPATGTASIICEEVHAEACTEHVPSSVRECEEGKGGEGKVRGEIQNPAAKAADPRFKEFTEVVSDYWKFKNPNIPLTFGPAEGKQLKNLLADNPSLSIEIFKTCLRHRARSDVVHSEPPRKWLSEAVKYANGPIDRYGKPLEENGNGKQSAAESRMARIIANTASTGRARPPDDRLSIGNAGDDPRRNLHLEGEVERVQVVGSAGRHE